jgi:hypothetical protein
MGKFSFEFKDHHDYLEKLKLEYADLRQEPLSSRLAMNFAVNAYHMCEWVWEHEPLVRVNQAYNKPMDFYDAINRACPSIPIMRDLTNGSKHTKITRGPAPVVKSTELHEGAFDPQVFSSAFDVSALLISMVDGTTRVFLDEATAAMDFWLFAFQTDFRI